MFLGPNLPHAYIAGDCIECMACSDNVVRAHRMEHALPQRSRSLPAEIAIAFFPAVQVRAGCTGKFKDVDNLVAMLTYETGTDRDQVRHRRQQRSVRWG